jgi:hypothetical protein
MPEEKPPVPTVLEVTKFMTSTAKRKRKSMFNSTPIVKGSTFLLTSASLNHANLGSIYAIKEINDNLYL